MFLFFIKQCLSHTKDFYNSRIWRYIIAVIIFLYISVYYALIWAKETEIIEVYRYFFITTVTTVGYGDFSPNTSEGRDIVNFLMITGPFLVAAVIGKIWSGAYNMTQRKFFGLSRHNVQNHILIMGYDSRITPSLINEILGDQCRENRSIVLCSSSLERNPFPAKDVKFVKGELDSHDVHERSCAAQAAKVIICGHDDGQSFLTAYSLRQVNTSAHLVVHLNSNEHASKVSGLPADDKDLNQSILPASTGLIVQEMQDPSSSTVLQQLMSNLDGATIYGSVVPEDFIVNWTFSNVFLYFRTTLNATIIAVKDNEGNIVTNPSMNSQVTPGMSLFYIGEKREQDISWYEIS